MKLYTYFRSSAAYRVRIAINLKQIPCELVPISLIKDGGEHHQQAYTELNPTALLPTLALDDGGVIRQSFAIIDYLERQYPTPPLLPSAPAVRAKALALSCDIGMEVHPLNNLRVLNHLKREHGFNQEMAVEWMRHWMRTTFTVLEQEVESDTHCVGDEVTLADVFLLPQLYNAQRWEVDMTPYPRLMRIHAHLSQLAAFADAHPDKQPDSAQ